MFDRASILRDLQSGETFDCLIIGGGATGLGTAVEAASRGHRVALVEQADFAKGTSSRSTKLVHGGVRYLRQGNLALVREALRERGRLLRNAPHLVHETPFVIPVPNVAELAWYGIGLKLYDRLAGRWRLSASELLDRAETLARLPNVQSRHLRGGVLYSDAQFDDARLAVNLAQTAREHGACVINYGAVVGLIKTAGRICGARVRDGETGGEFSIRARVVINATGVFVDALRAMEDAQVRPLVRVSQGTHLVLASRFLPGAAALMVPRTSDGRVFFAVPWQNRVILGTTDVPAERAALEPRPTAVEEDFLLQHARRHLEVAPSADDVLSRFAGLRPLVNAERTRPTAALSREHVIRTGPGGLITVTGGKWTTYRQMAEDVVAHVERLGVLRQTKSQTEGLRLHGWARPAAPDDGLTAYGSDADGIRDLLRRDPALGRHVHPAFTLRAAEVIWHARHEMARGVEDVLARRTRALLLDARASIEAAPAVATLMAQELGFDDAWARRQVAAYANTAARYVEIPGIPGRFA